MYNGFVAPDQQQENNFWQFVRDRQELWYRRFILKLPRVEWTKDTILQRISFGNVYRELDPGTQFTVEEILENQCHEEYWQVIAHLITYRMFNSIDTYRLIYPLITDAARGDDLSMAAIGIMVDEMLKEKVRPFGIGAPSTPCIDGESVGDATSAQIGRAHV